MDKNEFSRVLFNYLNKNEIIYAIAKLDIDDVSGAELADIIVCKNTFRKISRFIIEFCKESNFILVQKLYSESTSCQVVLCYYDNHSEKLTSCKINFQSDFKIKGRFYLSAKELLSNRIYIDVKNRWQLNDTYFFIYNSIRNIDKESISQKHFAKLFSCWANNYLFIPEKLKTFFSKESIEIIKQSFKEKEHLYFNANLNYLKKDLQAKVSKRMWDVIGNKISLLRCMINPPGLVVGLLGRDGTGKSTFVDEMARSLPAYFKGITTFKKCPAIFYKGAIFNKNEGYHFSKPHMYSQRNTFQSFLKLTLLFCEFMLGYWIKVFPLKAKSQLVLYDRYFIDVLADPFRYRIRNNKLFIKVIHYLLPKPDLWIILDLPSYILLQRKQELTFEMSEKLRFEYLRLQHMLSNCIVINNNDEIKKTVDKASAFIFNHMLQKIAV